MNKILYCHCAYTNVVPKDTKEAVLQGLCDSGEAFDSVADLCEMAAQQDPQLKSLAEDAANHESAGSCLKIAACYPRAVKWLFHSAGAPLPDSEKAVAILNMRDDEAGTVIDQLLQTSD